LQAILKIKKLKLLILTRLCQQVSTNLTNITYASTYINWTWTDPSDIDFDRVMIYLNGIFQRNITNGTQYYNATVLTPNTIYELGTKTVDIAGNINNTWKNNTSTTSPLPVLKVHNINKGTNYPTIQSAIDDANTGDEIHVDSDTYYENMNVTKQLTLLGVDTGGGMPVVNASRTGSAITLAADGIILEDLLLSEVVLIICIKIPES